MCLAGSAHAQPPRASVIALLAERDEPLTDSASAFEVLLSYLHPSPTFPDRRSLSLHYRILTKRCVVPLASLYDPVISPAGLMLSGKVPTEPGGSKVVWCRRGAESPLIAGSQHCIAFRCLSGFFAESREPDSLRRCRIP